MARVIRSLLGVVLGLALAGAAQANPPGPGSVGGADRGGGMFDSGQSIDRIPLTASDEGRRLLLYLWVVTHNNIYALATLNAVWHRTENRLPLARIPLLGQLGARPDYERADFAADKQVGTYYYAGQSMVVDLRPKQDQPPPDGGNFNWDELEAKLRPEAHRPVERPIAIDAKAAAEASSLSVFNRDSSYAMLLGVPPVREDLRVDAMKLLSRLPYVGHMFARGPVMLKDKELLILVPPSIVERAWN
jgi:hypothetical protein